MTKVVISRFKQYPALAFPRADVSIVGDTYRPRPYGYVDKLNSGYYWRMGVTVATRDKLSELREVIMDWYVLNDKGKRR